MPSLSIPNDFAAGQTPSASQFNANFAAVETFVNDTKLDTANLSTNMSNIVWSVIIGDVAAGSTSPQFRFQLPAGQDVEFYEAQISATGGTGSASLQFSVDGTGVLTTPLILSPGGAVAIGATVDLTAGKIGTGGDLVIVTVQEVNAAPNIVFGVAVTLYGKALVRT
jgi:adhesin HecA-like repeat protein